MTDASGTTNYTYDSVDRLTLDHPGRSARCRNCIADPTRVARLNGEIQVGRKIYEQVGLKTRSKTFSEQKTSTYTMRKKQ
jgi:hypothetical protein